MSIEKSIQAAHESERSEIAVMEELRIQRNEALGKIEQLEGRLSVMEAAEHSREASIAQYRKRLADACDKAVLREVAIDKNGGSSEEIAEARARADAYSDALAWAAAI